MEVTTVSPSPASPTEGDDLCEIDVSSVAIHSVTLLISLCGLAGNGAFLWLYSLNFFLNNILHLALADFLILLFMVPSALFFLVEDLSCSPIMPLMYVSFVFQLSELSCFWTLFQLMLPSYDVNTLHLTVLYCRFNIPSNLHSLMQAVQYFAFFALFTLMPTLSTLCPSHELGHCRAALILVYIIILLLFAAPMVIIPIINIIQVIRYSLKHDRRTEEMAAFIIVLFTLLLLVFKFLQQLHYILVSTQVVSLLNCIHSSIKPFIYFLAGRCWSPGSTEYLQLSHLNVCEEQEANAADSDDAQTDTGV